MEVVSIENRAKIISVALTLTFMFTLIHEIVRKIMMRGKIIGIFDHAIREEGENYPGKICFKYEVDGKVYYFESDNALKENDFSTHVPKIKLIYDKKNPSKAALDSGWIGLALQAALLAVSVIISKILVF